MAALYRDTTKRLFGPAVGTAPVDSSARHLVRYRLVVLLALVADAAGNALVLVDVALELHDRAAPLAAAAAGAANMRRLAILPGTAVEPIMRAEQDDLIPILAALGADRKTRVHAVLSMELKRHQNLTS